MVPELDPLNGPAEMARRSDIESMVVRWRAQRAKRLEMDKEVQREKDKEIAMKQWILAAMTHQGMEGVIIDSRATGVSAKLVPQCTDQALLCDYILETRRLDLLQFRISPPAINAMLDDGVKIPGVGQVEVFDLYDRKA